MKPVEDHLAELDAIVRAQGALLSSLIIAFDILTPGIAAETVNLAQAQGKAAQRDGENLAAYYLFSMTSRIVSGDADEPLAF